MFQRDSRISRYTYSSHNNRCINLRRKKKKKKNNWDKNSMNTHQNFHHVYSPALKSSPVERAARQQFKIPTATRRKFSRWKKKRDSSTFSPSFSVHRLMGNRLVVFVRANIFGQQGDERDSPDAAIYHRGTLRKLGYINILRRCRDPEELYSWRRKAGLASFQFETRIYMAHSTYTYTPWIES